MTPTQTHVPVVDCQQVFALMQHAQQLPAAEQTQLFNDLEHDPAVGPVVVAEARAHLMHHLS